MEMGVDDEINLRWVVVDSVEPSADFFARHVAERE